MDRVLALHAGSRGFDSHQGHISERFFRSNRPGYPHPVSSELENSGIRVAVVDCNVTERQRWHLSYQTCTCAPKTLQTQWGRKHSAGCVRQWFHTAVPLRERRYENWNTYTHTATLLYFEYRKQYKPVIISITQCSNRHSEWFPGRIESIFNNFCLVSCGKAEKDRMGSNIIIAYI